MNSRALVGSAPKSTFASIQSLLRVDLELWLIRQMLLPNRWVKDASEAVRKKPRLNLSLTINLLNILGIVVRS
jgi:hypothetical protein